MEKSDGSAINSPQELRRTSSGEDDFLNTEDLIADIEKKIRLVDKRTLIDIWFTANLRLAEGDVEFVPPPQTAPLLWQNRASLSRTNPAEFIRTNYAEYLGKGLTRSDIKRLDLKLYDAYAKWVKRHPEDELDLPKRAPRLARELHGLPADVKQTLEWALTHREP